MQVKSFFPTRQAGDENQMGIEWNGDELPNESTLPVRITGLHKIAAWLELC